jgi:N-acetyl-gamma-glutamyl-phosphate reductase
VPWAKPAAKNDAHLIANPGCYATSVLMPLIPLLKAGLIDPSSIVIDSKSGTSGGGRKAAENLLFTEVEGECLPYKVAGHQHFPEICQYIETFASATIDPHFTTQLINVRRGIMSCIYAKLLAGVTETQIDAAFSRAYSNDPLIRFGKTTSLSLKRVVGSARTHINYKIDGQKLYVFSLIDNLLKGAASQAVENFNRLNDLPAHTALTQMEGVL